MNRATEVFARELDLCRRASNPFDRFNSVVLRRPPLWSAQRKIGRALADPAVRRVMVPSGHMTGKDYSAAGFALGWLGMHAHSGVVIVGPKLDQVRRSTWAEVVEARRNSPLLAGVGKLGANPMSLKYDGDRWQMFVTAADSPEGLQGFHPRGPVLVNGGGASGLNEPQLVQALQSLKPAKWLSISNPLWAHGQFYEDCRRAVDDPSIRVVRIPSTHSPDAGVETSPRGLADAAWLRGMALDHGVDSTAYRVRVLAEFPDGGDDLLIPNRWLDHAVAPHLPGGPIRLAMDLGLGRGGDDTVHLVRDDNGIVGSESSKFRDFEASARRAKQLADHYGIPPARVTFDAAGIGAGFDYFLRAHGLVGCMPFVGAARSKSKRYHNLRMAAHFAMRRRLDPDRGDEDGRVRPAFSMPPDFLARFRRECRELTYTNLDDGRMALRDADEVKAALRHSPDYSVTLAQSFAFPSA